MSKAKSRPSLSPKPTSLAHAYDAFITSRQAQNVTSGTLGFYDDKLAPFVEWCTGRNVATVDAVTADHVRAYLVHLQGRELAPWTIHGAARAVRAFLYFCEEDGLIVKAPKFKMPKMPKKTLPAFEPGDVERLLDACLQFRDRVIILFLLDTGVRAAELIALDGGDIDERTGAVQVRQGKGQKDRTVYLGAKTRRELGRLWREHPRPATAAPAWTSLNDGRRLTESGLRQLLQRIGDRAGVKHCHPHTFRRTFALWSLRAGMDVYTLAALMGHEGIDVLKHYLALVSTDFRGSHAKHSPVDRMTK